MRKRRGGSQTLDDEGRAPTRGRQQWLRLFAPPACISSPEPPASIPKAAPSPWVFGHLYDGVCALEDVNRVLDLRLADDQILVLDLPGGRGKGG